MGLLQEMKYKKYSNMQKNKYALPAVNVVSTSSINAVLESARDNKSPAIIQFSAGGCQFFAGKGLSNDKYQSAIAGGISGAKHVHTSRIIWCNYNITY